MMTNLCLVYITCGTKDEASAIGRTLVKERLAACVNIIDRVESVYRWNGKIEEGSEAIILAKTRESLVKKLTARVGVLHSAECPCIVSIPIHGGSEEYMEWVDGETEKAKVNLPFAF